MRWTRRLLPFFLVAVVLAASALALGAVVQHRSPDDVVPEEVSRNPMHPAFPLLDSEGNQVEPGAGLPDDTRTCGECHDTRFIGAHSAHMDKGLDLTCYTCHIPGGDGEIKTAQTNEDGLVEIAMRPPTAATCGQCHGLVLRQPEYLELGMEFLEGDESGPYGMTLRTGEVFSPQMVSDSFLNIENKQQLNRPWTIHSARGLQCASCHFSPNNPERSNFVKQGQSHLMEDPRALSIGEYLKRPDHRLANATCTDCHDPLATHESLPYARRHMETLACQACHVPLLMAPALQSADHTVVTKHDGPRMTFRGVAESRFAAPSTWYIEGYQPFLLQESEDRGGKFAPYNLVARWDWVDAQNNIVPSEVLLQAWKDDSGAYHAEVLDRFDANSNGVLEDEELVLDSPEKEAWIAQRLVALGVENPRIRGEVQSHPIRHAVVKADSTASDCDSCHSADSRFDVPIELVTGHFPGGVVPSLSEETARLMGNRVLETDGETLRIAGSSDVSSTYILGHARRPWSDLAGFIFFVMAFLGVLGHGTLRYISSRRAEASPASHGPTKKVYMYGVYERIWHWVMALSIILLIFTGLQIHYPQSFDVLEFDVAVWVHNVMAVIMMLNAVLSLFYHITTGEIRQFLPERDGFIRSVTAQGMYYMRGIFAGASHPTAKSPDKKLNPLQQLTYVGLLNVLFPLQIITGILLWLGGEFPELVAPLGGLALIGPVHNLGSWLFMAFMVLHVYLTTTGHTLTSSIKAMVNGWEDIEEGEHQ